MVLREEIAAANNKGNDEGLRRQQLEAIASISAMTLGVDAEKVAYGSEGAEP